MHPKLSQILICVSLLAVLPVKAVDKHHELKLGTGLTDLNDHSKDKNIAELGWHLQLNYNYRVTTWLSLDTGLYYDGMGIIDTVFDQVVDALHDNPDYDYEYESSGVDLEGLLLGIKGRLPLTNVWHLYTTIGINYSKLGYYDETVVRVAEEPDRRVRYNKYHRYGVNPYAAVGSELIVNNQHGLTFDVQYLVLPDDIAKKDFMFGYFFRW